MTVVFGIIAALGLAGIVLTVGQLGWFRGARRGRRGGGAGAALGVVNEVFQPQLPTAQEIQRLNEGSERDDDDDDGAPPSSIIR
jgi:hypothetical protein